MEMSCFVDTRKHYRVPQSVWECESGSSHRTGDYSDIF